MKIKTVKLTGAALDWAVAKCLANVHEDAMLNGTIMHGWWISGLFTDPSYWIRNDEFNPSTNWTQGGPIIERERIQVVFRVTDGNGGGYWEAANLFTDTYGYSGATPLLAAMRCYVASKLGTEVEIPGELL